MNLKAFNDFWLDCYSTILYTILLSTTDIDKGYIYNNQYEYQLIKENINESGQSFYSMQSFTNHTVLKEKMLKDEQKIILSNEEESIDFIKKKMDERKIVLLGVDLFYFIEKNIHYHRNHVTHLSLLKSYDDGGHFTVFDTGNLGYQEFRIPHDRLKASINSVKSPSYIYRINSQLSGLMYTKSDIVNNAKNIIKSIEMVQKNQELIWNFDRVSESSLIYISDIIKTHLFNMQNRQKVNRHLFMIVLENINTDYFDYRVKFAELEQAFEVLRNLTIKYDYQTKIRDSIKEIKRKVLDLILIEKEIWSKFILKMGTNSL